MVRLVAIDRGRRRLSAALSGFAAGAAAVHAGAWLAGCTGMQIERPDEPGADPGPAVPPGRSGPLLSPERVLTGGFLAPPTSVVGVPARPGTGMFVRWQSPGVLALRGNDLLVLDAGQQRLWRADAALGTVTGIAGAPTGPGVRVALGPDLSAWVLDPVARRVLRFGRDGRLLQSSSIPAAIASPVALALDDGGLALLVGDGAGAQWSEQRGPAGVVQTVSPLLADGRRIQGVDALAIPPQPGAAPGGDAWVLDRLAAAVHRVRRDGAVRQTLGQGELMQPEALAVDRFGRAFVVDRGGEALVCLRTDLPAQRWAAAQLGAQRIAGLAVDERQLALADGLAGNVLLLRLGRP